MESEEPRPEQADDPEERDEQVSTEDLDEEPSENADNPLGDLQGG